MNYQCVDYSIIGGMHNLILIKEDKSIRLIDFENNLFSKFENAKELRFLREIESKSESKILCIQNYENQYSLATLDGISLIDYGVFDGFGKNVNESAVSAKKNGLWGYCNLSGKELIPFMYTKVSDTYTTYGMNMIVTRTDGFVTYINYKNEFVDEGEVKRYVDDYLEKSFK